MTRVPQDELGGRLPLIFPADLDEAQKAVYEGLLRTVMPEAEHDGFVARLDDGRFIGPFNALLRSPAIAQGLGRWVAPIAGAGLSEEVRQLVILAVGAVWNAEYEIAAHVSAARVAGIAQTAVEAVLAGTDPVDASPAGRVAWRLANSVVERREVPDDIYHDAVATFGVAGVVAILALVGQYQFISSILTCFQVPAP